MNTVIENRDLAIAAAHQLSMGAAELLRYATEGDCTYGGEFRFSLEPETLGQIADGLKMAMEVEAPTIAARNDTSGAEANAQMAAALIRFLDEWAV